MEQLCLQGRWLTWMEGREGEGIGSKEKKGRDGKVKKRRKRK